MKMLLVGAVGVVALQALLVWGYLALTAPDPLVTEGVQKVVICGGKRESGDIWYKLTEEVPGASGTWGHEYAGRWAAKVGGGCKLWLHYADTGPAD